MKDILLFSNRHYDIWLRRDGFYYTATGNSYYVEYPEEKMLADTKIWVELNLITYVNVEFFNDIP